MKIIMKATKVCGQFSSKNIFYDDIFFGRIKTEHEEDSEGVNYCTYMKTSHNIFFLAKWGKLIKKWMSGSHIVMYSLPIFSDDRALMSIR